MTADRINMTGVSKRFGGVEALSGVDFTVRAAEVHALLGENGAGKSTLIRILTGVHAPDAGRILLDDRPFRPRTPADALRLGVAAVHQELQLIPTLSVAENVMLGRMPRRRGLIDWRGVREKARRSLGRLGLEVDVSLRLDACSAAVRQIVAVARALYDESGEDHAPRAPRVIVMDEPTSSLDRGEALRILDLVRRIRASGTSVIFISHSLDDVYAVADRMTVLREGRCVGVFEAGATPRVELVRHMLGRSLSQPVSPSASPRPRRVTDGACAEVEVGDAPLAVGAATPLLVCRNLSRRGAVESASFQLSRGEVLGFAGLLGSGRTETARLVFGVDRADGGELLIDGGIVRGRNPANSIRRGLAFCPEDRATEGVIGELSIRENVALVVQRRLSRWGLVSRRLQLRIAEEMIRRMNIVSRSPEQPVRELSGGNQQKVVLARWLAASPRLLILDEPTRGIDIGAKQTVEALVRELSSEGMSLIFISAELEEVLRTSDRILVFHDRRCVGEVRSEDVDLPRLVGLIAGADPEIRAVAPEDPASDVKVEEPHRVVVRFVTPPAAPPPVSERAVGPTTPRREASGDRRGYVRRHAWVVPLVALLGVTGLTLMLAPRFGRIEWRDGRLDGAAVQVVRQAAPVIMLAVGMTLVIGLGGIDLSVGAVMAMAGAAGALVLTRGGSATTAVCAGIAVGAGCGAWNGALVSIARVPPIIATLILLVAGRGLAQLPTEGLQLTVNAPGFARLASGHFLGLPLPFHFAMMLALIVVVVTRGTVVGLYLEAAGAGRAASHLCGLRLRTLEFLTYVASGLCAGFAGLLVTADARVADVSNCGLYLELDAILAVVIGGTRLSGGRLRIGGAVLGALLMQTLTTAMLMSRIAPEHALIIKGAAALAVCLVTHRERM
ncbi:MAG: Vitamin B12 import ATP-binding protein BtuD [Phycisphaerae bacterium]|nr:Vitamin B12 import ATP-binding protein BtuD [Phycisphaerae bacterium]